MDRSHRGPAQESPARDEPTHIYIDEHKPILGFYQCVFHFPAAASSSHLISSHSLLLDREEEAKPQGETYPLYFSSSL
jgi:hypothetical protein